MDAERPIETASVSEVAGPRPHVRIATWNVHGALGLDLRRSVDRVAEVLRSLAVDVALLQELDVGRERSDWEDQPAAIAIRLGFEHVFGAAIVEGRASYGNAIVSRCPLEAPATYVLPSGPGAERRAATRAIAVTPIGPIEVVVTHLGLLETDRDGQVEEILSRLGPPECPRVLGGDLNDGPRARALARLGGETLLRADSRPTYPAFLPFLRLDHLLVDRRVAIADVERPSIRTIRGASDHLPIVVTLTRRPEVHARTDEAPCPRAEAT